MNDKIIFFSRKSVWVLLILLTALTFKNPVYGQYVHTNGTQILDENGNDIYFSGMNLGNWLLWEGYLMMGDFNYRTHTQFFNSVKDAFGGDLAKAMEFEHQWRMNYVTEEAIIELKGLGFNSVRIPFNYNLFWDGNTVKNDGFQYFDRVIQFCRNQGMYVMLDMHAAPGYQNPGDHSDNVNSNAGQPRESVTFWDGNNVGIASQVWKHIATYYANEPVIWGYDLINEPVPQAGREYELLGSMITMRNAIREVDNNHVIIAEGSWWGSDMQKIDWMDAEVQNQSGINYRWDNNLVYQTHHYSNDVSALEGRLAICNKLNVPMILGEYGESDNNSLRNMTDWCINNNVDYFPWSFKKMSHDKCLWTIHPNGPYEDLKAFINNGTNPPATLYDDMISFCQNNIANGSNGLTWDQGWYDGVKPNIIVTGCNEATAINSTAIIEAEDYCEQYGLQTEDSSEGGLNLGYADPGDWADYRINNQTAGNYEINVRVASGDTGNKSIELIAGANSTTLSFEATGGWQNYNTISGNIYLGSGVQTIRLAFPVAGVNVDWVELVSVYDEPVLSSISISPSNVTLNIGDTQQFVAQGFDQNGDEMAVFPTWTGTNQLGVLTASESGVFTVVALENGISGAATVTINAIAESISIPGLVQAEAFADMNGVQTESGSEGSENIGWVDNGDWVEYNVNVQETGNYTLNFRVAADGAANKTIELVAGANNTTVNFGATGGWQNWATISGTIGLNSGNQSIRLNFLSDGINVDWLELLLIDSEEENPQVTIRVEAEDYFEMSGLQAENTSDTGGGQNMGWIDGGDWAGYNVDIPSEGIYTVSYRVASQNGGGQIQLEAFGGGAIYGAVNVDPTGGWQNWSTVSHTVSLPAGSQTLGLSFISGGFNMNWIEITSNSPNARKLVGTVNSFERSDIGLYPNPVNSVVTLSGLNGRFDRLIVYGISGHSHMDIELAETDEQRLNVSQLESGIYLIQVTGNGIEPRNIKFTKK